MAPLKILLASLCALTLAACATAKPGPAPRPGPRPIPAPAPAPVLEQFSDLPGWAADDHAAAFEAYRSTCGAARDAAMGEICRRARARPLLSGPEARAFFEDNFRPEAVPGEGVLTAYYAPEYEARARPDAEFSAPVRPKPIDLVSSGQGGRDAQQRGPDGKLGPYPDRTAIETSPPTQVLAWMRPEELFFLQVQGSGVVTYPDGRRVKVLFAATNGRTFTGIANPMRDRGLLAANNTSGEAIRQWLADHRGPEADAIMRLNPRYVFFTTAPDDGRPPVGSAGIPLPTGRAIAVDPSRHASGELFWIDGVAPILNGAFPTYRRLVTALDVGGAIKGLVRADLYLGQGQRAGTEAGRVRHTLRMHRLVPRVGPGR
ncbi:MltA domain-containing protein [Phenylobacterium sp.]|uniref:MltA domain-containing protein n=1 Tax=Phenylobacterium sp. TaxID=1871053 RepID=UPI002737829D|nr:MltA domain-containing protein [Phenylobacterium sp.]MDP3868874.1 MltA domain-containing protein [Phenylobacterium sp.]